MPSIRKGRAGLGVQQSQSPYKPSPQFGHNYYNFNIMLKIILKKSMNEIDQMNTCYRRCVFFVDFPLVRSNKNTLEILGI